MLHLKIALHWALSVLSIPLLLPQGTTYANSFFHPFYDTVYLNRSGKEITPGPHTKIHKTFIVRTTLTTEDLYGIIPEEKNHRQRGNVNSISEAKADTIENLIKKGKFEEARQAGNLVELRPLAERQADGIFILRDNGEGGEATKNNREYATIIYKGGRRQVKLGKVADPCKGGIGVDIPVSENIIMYSHSHPSGKKQVQGTPCYFYPQAPSKADIKKAPVKQTRVVFGRDSDLVYIYNRSGVIAALPTNVYITL